jgi:hypothetical protein
MGRGAARLRCGGKKERKKERKKVQKNTEQTATASWKIPIIFMPRSYFFISFAGN